MLTDSIFRLKEATQFLNLDQEVDACWNLQINPNMLEVKHDALKQELYLEHGLMRRIDITSVRDSLSGYQKGKCFYSFQDIFVNKGNPNICTVSKTGRYS